MKAPPFSYVRARSLEEVFDLLERHGEGAKLLAGGQSLIASLNLRLSAPRLLIDISRLAGLSGIAVRDGMVAIGALTTHAEIERSPEVRARLPLLAQAAPYIAHPAVRNAGTIGGSLALADPAAEWPACCVALDARFALAGKAGTRRVAAREFFHGLYTTDLRPREVLTGIEIPLPEAGHRSAFVELTLRRGDYAMVGLAAVAAAARGTLSGVRLVFLGVGTAPVVAAGAMAAMEGKRVAADTLATMGRALAKDLHPLPDLYASTATKLQLARVLAGRALTALAA